jgi:hypothetical protein
MNNLVQNFSDFSYSINEGNSYKKEYGVLGPFSPWGYKIKTCCPEKGGEPTDSMLIVSDLDGEGKDLCLKYLYGEGKESDPFYLPKGSFIIDGTPKNPILQTKRHTKWWDDENNQDHLDEFLDSFMESKNFTLDLDEDIEGDVCSLMEILDLDSSVSKVDQKKDLHWIASLEDGMEMEIKKRDKDNLFKVLKFYLDSNSHTPEVEVIHEKPGYEVLYSTPRGKFSRKCSTVSDLSKDPVHKYLFSASMKKDPSLYQGPVLNYLNSVLKNQDWRPSDKKKIEESDGSLSEADQLKKILLNTISEKDLDEIYSSARQRYSPSNSGN